MKDFLARTLRRRLSPKVAARPQRRYRAMVFQTYLVGALIAFAGLLVLVRRKPYFETDLKICRAVQRVDSVWAHRLMHWVSLPGYPPQANLIVPALTFVLYRVGLRWEAVMELFNSVGIGVVGLLVKLFVNRPRPKPELVRVRASLDGGTLSFPAGHVQTYTAIIGFLAFISFTVVRRSWQRTLALATSFGMIALIGPSRIHAGEHWPSDVLGGYFLGSIWLWLTIQLYRWGKPRFFVNQPLATEKRSAA